METKAKGKIQTRQLAQIGVMAAVICVLSPFSIPLPFSPVPITLLWLAIFLSVYVLGMRGAAVAYLVYLLVGFAGLPVFSGFTSGPAKILGPTGGYMVSAALMALIAGYFVDRFSKWYLHIVGMALGAAVSYVFGSVWLSVQAGMTLKAAFMAGTIPFIPADMIKIIFAAIIGPQIRRSLVRAGLRDSG